MAHSIWRVGRARLFVAVAVVVALAGVDRGDRLALSSDSASDRRGNDIWEEHEHEKANGNDK